MERFENFNSQLPASSYLRNQLNKWEYMLLLLYTPCLTPGTPTEARKNFSHKGKRSGNNGKWIHRSGLDPCQFERNGVN
jgi:hypothetical protein